ncbi:MAG: hypothetical protein OEP48_11070 [Betaproteobacteria bacterium]|nr:hypothetical protein [Betaproteobacteria bacterium]MDH3437649.1 hypothetical protein [Betaproteobacteria bacterium]
MLTDTKARAAKAKAVEFDGLAKQIWEFFGWPAFTVQVWEISYRAGWKGDMRPSHLLASNAEEIARLLRERGVMVNDQR